MEDLSKHQLILLTLLISFITSIATGIITFTLLQEAPVEVTNTINRVVEKTIEQVTPVDDGKTIVKEVQVVKEEDLVLESIEKSAKSIVRVKTLAFDGSEVIVGLGLVVADGVVVMDERSASSNSNYTILFSDNKAYGISKSYSQNSLTFLKVGKPVGEKYTFYPVIFGNTDSLKLGQTIIAVGGKQSNSVSIGRVAQLERGAENIVSRISTDIPASRSQMGSPLLNLSGEIVGLEAAPLEGESTLSFLSINVVKGALETALNELSR